MLVFVRREAERHEEALRHRHRVTREVAVSSSRPNCADETLYEAFVQAVRARLALFRGPVMEPLKVLSPDYRAQVRKDTAQREQQASADRPAVAPVNPLRRVKAFFVTFKVNARNAP